jgi:hypothetical protein
VRVISGLGLMGEMFRRKTVALTPLVRYRTGELGNSGAEPGSATGPGTVGYCGGTWRSSGRDMSPLESSTRQLMALAVCVVVGPVVFNETIYQHTLLGDGLSGGKHALCSLFVSTPFPVWSAV